jgi:hypothetical protein
MKPNHEAAFHGNTRAGASTQDLYCAKEEVTNITGPSSAKCTECEHQ